ncbi:MAG: DUF6318 family protein [Actinomycetota bacterium]|nr:DUF6318 family protein [Actinomycetota bacterium]
MWHGDNHLMALGTATVLMLCAACAGPAPDGDVDAGQDEDHEHRPLVVPTDPAPVPTPLPRTPADARRATRDGAAAFVRYYFAAMDYAFASGDASMMERLSSSDCDTCRGLIQSARAASEDGRSTRGGSTTVRRAQVLGAPASGTAEVRVTYDAAAFVELDPHGQPVQVQDAQHGRRAVVGLQRVGTRWKVTHIADL